MSLTLRWKDDAFVLWEEIMSSLENENDCSTLVNLLKDSHNKAAVPLMLGKGRITPNWVSTVHPRID